MNRFQFVDQDQRPERPVGADSQAEYRSSDAALAAAGGWFGDVGSGLRSPSYAPRAWPWAFKRSRVSRASSGLAAFHRQAVWEDVTFLILGLSGLAALVICFCEL
jgi:hypothetical protein